MHPEYTPAPGAVAQPTEYKPPAPDANPAPAPVGEHVIWAADGSVKAPSINVLADKFGVPKPPPVTPPGTEPPKSKKPLVIAVVIGTVLLLGGITAAFVVLHPKSAPVAVSTPSPTPSPSPSATPSPTPSLTPSPTPAATPTPALALTVPSVAPTTSQPQSSVVTSPTGLWLRSSPTSVNKSNIIGWMPKGATVSVDSIGDFWWHGVYNGQAGYFASKYTN
jgi:hypothetical protein